MRELSQQSLRGALEDLKFLHQYEAADKVRRFRPTHVTANHGFQSPLDDQVIDQKQEKITERNTPKVSLNVTLGVMQDGE